MTDQSTTPEASRLSAEDEPWIRDFTAKIMTNGAPLWRKDFVVRDMLNDIDALRADLAAANARAEAAEGALRSIAEGIEEHGADFVVYDPTDRGDDQGLFRRQMRVSYLIRKALGQHATPTAETDETLERWRAEEREIASTPPAPSPGQEEAS